MLRATICVPLLLVAQDDTDPEAVSLILETIYESPLTSALRSPALSDQVNAFPRHAGTERYLHRNDPPLTPEVSSQLIRVVTGLAYFLWGAIALYGFLRLRKLRRAIPVKAYSAHGEGGPFQLNQLHAECHSRFRVRTAQGGPDVNRFCLSTSPSVSGGQPAPPVSQPGYHQAVG
jgi:hypothetical protein